MAVKYLSNRVKDFKVGISNYSESKTSVSVIGGVGIGTVDTNLRAIYAIGNAEVVGVLTATSIAGISGSFTSLNVTGITTFSDDITLATNKKLNVGTANTVKLWNNGAITRLQGEGNAVISVDTPTSFGVWSGATSSALFKPASSVDLYYAGTKRFETAGTGVTVTGTVYSDQLNISGVSTFNGNVTVDADLFANNLTVRDNGTGSPTVMIKTDDQNPRGLMIKNDTYATNTAVGFKFGQQNNGEFIFSNRGNNEYVKTSFKAHNGTTSVEVLSFDEANNVTVHNALNVSGVSTFTGAIDANGDLDVDGHTELDNLNVSGVSTFNDDVNLLDNDVLRFGNTGDLQISHNGTDSIIKDAGAGRLKILGGYQVWNVGNTTPVLTVNTSNSDFGNVGIGTLTPLDPVGSANTAVLAVGIVTAYKLYGHLEDDVNYNLFAGTNAGAGNTTGGHNVSIGQSAGCAVGAGSSNVFLGTLAGSGTTTDLTHHHANVFIGDCAGKNALSSNSIAIGKCAGYSLQGSVLSSIFMGTCAGSEVTGGVANIGIGLRAGCKLTGGYNIMFGSNAGRNTTSGGANIFMGRNAGTGNTAGGDNISLGYQSSDGLRTGARNIVIGAMGGSHLDDHGDTTSNDNVYIGYFAGTNAIGSCNVAIGRYVKVIDDSGDNQLAIGSTNGRWIVGDSNFNVGIGTTNFNAVVGSGVTSKVYVGILSAYKLYGNGLEISGGSIIGEDIVTRNLKATGISTLGVTSTTDLEAQQLNVSGLSTFTGNATFSGDAAFHGGVQLGNASSDTINGTGRFSMHLVPGSNQDWDLGISDRNWRELHVKSIVQHSGVSTFAGAIDANGDLDVAGVSTFNDDAHFVGAAGSILFDKSQNRLEFDDDVKAIFGDGHDLEVWHDGSNAYIENAGAQAGDLYIRSWSANKELHLQAKGAVEILTNETEKAIIARQNGDLELYHADSLKLETTEHGIDVTGHTETDTLNVSGLSTFAGITTVTGDTLFTKQLNVSGVITATTLKVDGTSTFGGNVDIADTIYHTGDSNTKIRFPANDTITFHTSGVERLRINSVGDVNISGTTTTGNLSVSGVSTFTGTLTANGLASLNGDVTIGSAISDSVEITARVNSDFIPNNAGGRSLGQSDKTWQLYANNVTVAGISTFTGAIDANGDLDVAGNAGIGSLNVTGVSTFSDDVTFTGASYNAQWDKSENALHFNDNAEVTFGNTSGSPDLSIYHDGSHNYLKSSNGRLYAQGVSRMQLQVGDGTNWENSIVCYQDGSTDIYYNGVKKIETTDHGISVSGTTTSTQLNVTGLSTFSDTILLTDSHEIFFDDANAQIKRQSGNLLFNLSGDNDMKFTTNASGGTGGNIVLEPKTGENGIVVNSDSSVDLYHNNSIRFQTTGIGVTVVGAASTIAYIEGPGELWIDPHPAGVGDTSGTVRIRGDLYVDGSSFVVHTGDIEFGDFIVGIASTVPTNALLDGAGIGIGSTGIRKFITWSNSTSSLKSSENWNLESGKHYEIAGTDVLTATTLGSGVVNSSLTSVGTLGSLTVSGNINANGNIVGDNSTNITGIAGVTASTLTGTLQTAAQSNVTSLGTLTGLTVSGTSTLGVTSTTDLEAQQLKVTGVSTFSGNINLINDSSGGSPSLRIGAGADLQLHHDGSDSYITNSTGQLAIKTPDDSVAISITDSNTVFNDTTKFNSSVIVSEDIAHIGDTNTKISFPSGGDQIIFKTAGSERLSIADHGINVSGTTTSTQLNVTGITTFNDDVQFKGASYNVLWDEATSKLKFYDLAQATFGDGNDLQIYSDGTNGIIKGNDKTNITGITSVTATTYYGDGGSLTGITTGSWAVTSGDKGTGNLYAGTHAGSASDSDTCYNIAVGHKAACTLNEGDHNIFLGTYSGLSATTAACNVAIGYSAGTALTVGDTNILIGKNAGTDTEDGRCNVAIGHSAGALLTGGYSNVLIGTRAGENATGSFTRHSVAIGNYAGNNQLCHDVYIGCGAGFANDGKYNVFLGSGVGAGITDGNCNVMMGHLAGKEVTTGDTNVIIGRRAGQCATESENNVFIGGYAGWNTQNTASGDTNVVIGYAAGMCLGATARCNTMIGPGAGQELDAGCDNVLVGQGPGYNIAGGSYNTFLGHYTGDTTTSGSNNVAIGKRVRLPSATGSNQFAIGCCASYWITGNADFNVGIGTTNPNAVVGAGNTAKLSVGIVSTYKLYSNDLVVTGVSTFNDNVHLLDSDKLLLGGSAGTHDGLEIYHSSTESNIVDSGTGVLRIGASQLNITNAALTETQAKFIENGQVQLYNDNVKKFATIGLGVTVFGTTQTQTLNVSGLSTFNGAVEISPASGYPLTLQASNSTIPAIKIDNQSGTQRGQILANDFLNIEAYGNDIIFDPNHGGGTAGDILLKSDSTTIVQVPGDKSGVIVTGIVTATAFSGTNLNVSGVSTFAGTIDANGALDVDGQTDLDVLNVSEAATFSDDVFINVRGKKFKTSDWSITNTTSGNALAISGGSVNTEKVRIDSAGDVGIGTDNPEYLLDIQKDTDVSLRIKCNGTNSTDDTIIRNLIGGTTGSNYIYFGDSGDSNVGLIRYAHGNDSMLFKTAATEQVRINSDGDVGIGTDNPQKRIHVLTSDNSVARLETSAATGRLEFKSSGGAANPYIEWKDANLMLETDGEERLRIASGGQVGIGTTGGTYNLHVSHDASTVAKFERTGGAWAKVDIKAGADSGNSYLMFSRPAQNEAGSVNYEHNVNELRLEVWNGSSKVERMNVNSSGIEVTGVATATSFSGDGSALTNITASPAGSNKQIQYNNSGSAGGASKLWWDESTDRLGIGADSSPDATIHIKQDSAKIQIESESNPRQNYIGVTDSDNLVIAADEDALGGNSSIRFRVDADEKVRITSDGAVGIGTDAPGALLDITGDTSSAPFPGIHLENDGNSLSLIDFVSHRTGIDNTVGTLRGYWGTGTHGNRNQIAGISFKTGNDTSNKDEGYMIFQTSDAGGSFAERMRIAKDGKVGIGTTNPQRKLHLVNAASNPKIRFDRADNFRNNWIGMDSADDFVIAADEDNAGGNSSIRFRIDADEKVRITDAGYVGIGTDAPGGTLQINHASPKIILEDNDNGGNVSIANVGGAAVYSSVSDVVFQTADTSEKVRIATNGKVGIGTYTPDAWLHIQTSSTTGDEDLIKLSRNHYEVGKIRRSAGNMKVSGDGNLYLEADYNADHGATDSNIIFTVDGDEKVRINSSGNVGIGTETPTDPANSGNSKILSVGVVTCNNLYVDGASITGGAGGLWHSNDTGISTSTSVGIGTTTVTGAHLLIKTAAGSDGSPTTKKGLLVQEAAYSDGNLIEAQFSNGTTIFRVGGNPNHIDIPNDTSQLRLGTGQDLKLYHSGSASYIDNSTGFLFIHGNDIALRSVAQENYIVCDSNGSVDLYYDGGKTLETTANGVTIYDDGKDDEARLIIQGGEGNAASLYFYADDGDDDADKWRMLSLADGTLNIQNYAAGSWETSLKSTGNGNVELYYDNAKKLETTSGGLNVTGKAIIDAVDVTELSNGATTNGIFLNAGDTGAGNRPYIDIKGAGTSALSGKALRVYYDNGGTESFYVDYEGNISGRDINGTGDLTLTSTDAGSSAEPIIKLFRNSASPADADYLGQIKFAGENDNDEEINYAKITGKILDASDGTEDGALEFAHIKAGSETITGRWRSDSLQLLNGTNLTVAGTAEVTGTSTFGVVNITSSSTFTGNVLDFGESKQLRFGAGNDFAILHNGNTLLENDTAGGNLTINNKSTSGKIYLNVSDGENALVATPDGSVEIYYDDSKKFETTATGITVTGTCQATDFNSTSDIRLKDNIQTIEDPLAKLVQIEGVSFNWKENNKPALGVIADQVQEILPELVTDGDPKTVNYNGLIGLLIEAVKEQQTQIDKLNDIISKLE